MKPESATAVVKPFEEGFLETSFEFLQCRSQWSIPLVHPVSLYSNLDKDLGQIADAPMLDGGIHPFLLTSEVKG